MRPDIHPNYAEIQVTCSCGHTFTTGSSLGKNLHIEVCNECHPFYTGKQKIVDTAGRVERFKNKFTNFSKTHADNKAATPAPKAPAKATKKSVKKEKSTDTEKK